ncbi:MAG: ATP-binding protein [Crocinitomicaceae bacterium]
MVTVEFKQRVIEALKEDLKNYPSASKQAVTLGLNPAQLSRISKGETEQVISDASWMSIARRLDVSFNKASKWITANTPVFEYINNQLLDCKNKSISGILCDDADIGKTHAAKHFVKSHKNTIYIDCSQVKSKQKLIRQIAKEFGCTHTGKYADVYEDLVYYLRSIDAPLVVLDEAGDLDYPAFLEIKALWNATEGSCAWYLIGADGLKAKMTSNIDRKKVGYTEIFSRFGNRYQKIVSVGLEARTIFTKTQVALIVKANRPDSDIQVVYASTNGSLRRIKTELQKTN